MKRYLYVCFTYKNTTNGLVVNIITVYNFKRLKINEKGSVEVLNHTGWDWVSEGCYIFDTSHYVKTNGDGVELDKIIYDKGVKYLEKKIKLKKYIKLLV